MYLPRRSRRAIVRPATAAAKSSGSGWRTMSGKRSSTRSILTPVRCGRRFDTTVSTSGSSGTARLAGDRGEAAHVSPVLAGLGLDLDPALQLVGAGHDPRHDLGERAQLAGWNLEDELIVDLEQHPAGKAGGAQLAVQPDHGDLDDVGRQ